MDILFLDDFVCDVTCEEFYDIPDGHMMLWDGEALCDLNDWLTKGGNIMVSCDERCANCPWYEDCYEHGVDPDECEALQNEEFNNLG